MRKKKMLFVLLLLLMDHWGISQEATFPGQHWQIYERPAAAGFDEQKLASLQQKFVQQGGSSFLVIQGGKVAIAWGEPNRRYLQASIRKSYLSALFGVFAEEAAIDLEQSLANLGIDDRHTLTLAEQKATILDLLRAKSGIYLPAAYSPRGMAERMPARGSHAPGTFWYYNNWDFNALSSIFHQLTERDLFASFQERIAEPLQMEDFRLSDTYYRYERDKSIHPAYLFKMSARDMARFGLLFLRAGIWENQQLIPAAWVKESTRIHTADLGADFAHRGGYGLLWWIAPPVDGNQVYYASGAGGQRIFVIPDQDMVVVHLVDTYQNRHVKQTDIQDLLLQLLQAKTGQPQLGAKLKSLQFSSPTEDQPVDQVFAQSISRSYDHPFLKRISIHQEEEGLYLQTGVGRFDLLPNGDRTFMVEDIQMPILFEKGTQGQKGKAKSIMNDQRELEKLICYY